jgi:hypothetical protein
VQNGINPYISGIDPLFSFDKEMIACCAALIALEV